MSSYGYGSKQRRLRFRRSMEEARPYDVPPPRRRNRSMEEVRPYDVPPPRRANRSRRGNNSREQHDRAGDPVVPHSPQPPSFESRFDIGVKLLADLWEEVRATRRELQELKAQVATVQSALSVPITHLDPPDLLSAPLSQQSELNELESRLAADDDLGESLVLHLTTKGGRNAKDAVYRMMPSIMSNTLAKTINWTGQGGKMAFKSLKVKDILHRAIRRNSNTKDVTEETVQYEVIRYLKGASDRDGGRKKLKTEEENTGLDIDDVWTDTE